MENSIQISWVQLSQIFVTIQPHMRNINSGKDITWQSGCLTECPVYMYQWTTLAFVNWTVFLTIKVVRLDERDRYKQLVAQFTTIQTPESVGTSWNRTVAEPLQVDTDFLTKTRSHGRQIMQMIYLLMQHTRTQQLLECVHFVLVSPEKGTN